MHNNLTMESKFVALDVVGKDAEWFSNLMFEIPFILKHILLYQLGVIVL